MSSIVIPPEGIRLNIGAGRHVMDGYVNVDIAVDPKAPRPPELLTDAKDLSALPDCCATELMAIHLWEHFYLWDCDTVIAEWHRVMRPGALLILELPDLFKFCQNILDGRPGRRHPDQLGMWGLFGDPRDKNPYQIHRWGWTFKTLAPYLKEHGFKDVVERQTQWHSMGRHTRDFRVEALRA